MMETTDGFLIAEKDLQLRGPGELLGLRQSGFPGFKAADLLRHGAELQWAREDASAVLREDPGFLLPQNAILSRVLATVPPFEGFLMEAGA